MSTENLITDQVPGAGEYDPPLQRVGYFLSKEHVNFKFRMNVIYHEDLAKKIVGCIIGATLHLYRGVVEQSYQCPVALLPLCGIPYSEVAQEILNLTDEEFDQLCYPENVDFKRVTSRDAAKACYELAQTGGVDWEEIVR